MSLSGLKHFVELQSKDIKIDDLKQKSSEIPSIIDNLKSGFEERKQEVQGKQEDYKRHLLKRKELESELSAKEELIKKHQKELNQIKSNEAFKALLTEIKSAENEAGNMETDILICLDEIETAAKNEKALLEGLKNDETETENKINELNERKENLDKHIKKLEEERQTFCADLDADIFEKYKYLRLQKNGLAVCPVQLHSDGSTTCSGCNIILTPQYVVDLKKKDKFVICENCQRILFSPVTLKEEEEAGRDKK